MLFRRSCELSLYEYTKILKVDGVVANTRIQNATVALVQVNKNGNFVLDANNNIVKITSAKSNSSGNFRLFINKQKINTNNFLYVILTLDKGNSKYISTKKKFTGHLESFLNLKPNMSNYVNETSAKCNVNLITTLISYMSYDTIQKREKNISNVLQDSEKNSKKYYSEHQIIHKVFLYKIWIIQNIPNCYNCHHMKVNSF